MVASILLLGFVVLSVNHTGLGSPEAYRDGGFVQMVV